jgi:hypothetical protein
VGLDDFMSTETAFVAAATAAVLSPKTRDTLRKGAVYGVAGALKAGDVVAGAARGAVRGVRGDETAASDTAAAATPAKATPARSTRSRRTNSSGGSGTSARRASGSTKASGSGAGS